MNDCDLTLPAFVKKYGASVRLQNVALQFWLLPSNPYKTTKEIADARVDGLALLFEMPNAGRKTISELEFLLEGVFPKAFNPPTPIESASPDARNSVPLASHPEELVSYFLNVLKHSQREIITKRFGLADGNRQTLEEIGTERGVTRERVRQIESKGLGRLRARYTEDAKRFVEMSAQTLWAKLSNGSDAITQVEVERSIDIFSPSENFLIYLAFGSTGALLKTMATQTRLGWIRGHYSTKELAAYQSELNHVLQEVLLPRPLVDVGTLAKQPTGIEKVFLKDIHSYNGYVSASHFGRRLKRTVRLHQLLINIYGGSAVQPAVLLDKYLQGFKDDQCSYRDLEIVLARYPHLFVNLYDEGWMGIGQSTEDYRNADEVEENDLEGDGESIEEEPRGTGELTSISGALRTILKAQGPLQFVDLRKAFVAEYGGSGSKNSVGPILVMRPTQFIRLAPGVYGLPEHVEKLKAATEIPTVLLNSRQCQLYCLARWSGEAANMFPLWNPVTEYGWAKWARTEAEPHIFHSLLVVSSIDNWMIADANKEYWRDIKSKCTLFQLEANYHTRLTKTVPTMRQVLGAALFAKQKGRIGWMSANRLIGARIDDTHAVSILAILIGLGVVEAPTHWQRDHVCAPERTVVLEKLLGWANQYDEAQFEKKAWELIQESRQTPQEELGWVEQRQLKDLMGNPEMGVRSPPPAYTVLSESDEDLSLADALKQFRKERAERALRESETDGQDA